MCIIDKAWWLWGTIKFMDETSSVLEVLHRHSTMTWGLNHPSNDGAGIATPTASTGSASTTGVEIY
jgi:hypothetical protein